VIVAEQLTKRFGSRTAVDTISFEVPAGEVVGFLGPNGAGKSTTLKMVAGFLPPTSGRVEVAGYDVVDESIEARKHLGYMPEAVPLYPEMRVEEYLSFRAEIKGVPRAKRKASVQRAMEQADVADVARRVIGELSKGYKQRVGLADALVASPKLLILDEPTAGLDPNQILQVRELIKSLGKEHTIFLSTHILPEVEAVCSRVLIISRGRIAAQGSVDEIHARMTGEGRQAELIARGSESAIREAVTKVGGIKIVGEPVRVETSSGTEAIYRFQLDISEQEQGGAGKRAESLVEACVASSVGVRGLEVRGKSLESIFHELTTAEVETDRSASEKTTARTDTQSTEEKSEPTTEDRP
jgi:ABC-2 type transport system ATP-binding protein